MDWYCFHCDKIIPQSDVIGGRHKTCLNWPHPMTLHPAYEKDAKAPLPDELLNPPDEIVPGETGNARVAPAMTGPLPIAGAPTSDMRNALRAARLYVHGYTISDAHPQAIDAAKAALALIDKALS